MKYRELGATGIEVSEIALGCWPFAGGSYWGRQDLQTSIDTVHAALDAGINFFDTAEGYEDGESERVLGQALKDRRSEAVIATKVSTENLRPPDVISACERSLGNLGTDYIDLYQIHWPNHDVPIEETADAFQRLKEQGKVRAVGVSNFAVKDLTELLDVGECVVDQLPYSLLWRVIERQILPFCVERKVGIVCYSPLAQGLLTGRYRNADEVPEGLAQARWYSCRRPAALHDEAGVEEEVFEAINTLRQMAEDAGMSMATMALAWVRHQSGVTSFLVGARSPDELAWNLPVLELRLAPEMLTSLSDATETVKRRLGSNPDMWLTPGRMR